MTSSLRTLLSADVGVQVVARRPKAGSRTSPTGIIAIT